MKQTIILITFIIFSVFSASALEKGDMLTGRIVKVLDGDTYEVLLPDYTRIRVRMYGIDAPEKAMPYYQVSRKYLSDLCIQQTVRVQIKDFDMHNRVVALTYLGDGRELSHEMIRAGLAWHYRQYSKDKDLKQLEQTARSAKIGLWQDKYPVASWVVRKWNRKSISTKAIFADMNLRRQASEASFL